MNTSLIKPTDGWVSRYINRPISTKISHFLSRFPISPNLISFTILLLTLLFPFFFSLGTQSGIGLGILWYQLLSILDGCDGEIARLKNQSSSFGATLDTLTDQWTTFFFLITLGWGLSHLKNETNYLTEGFLTGTGFLIMFLVIKKIDSKKKQFSDFGKSTLSQDSFLKKYPFIQNILIFFSQILRKDVYAFIFLLFPILEMFGVSSYHWILHFFAAGVILHIPVIILKLLRGNK